MPAEIKITTEELMRCKRATVVLAEIAKAAMGGKQAPLEMREDLLTLTKVLRRLEPVANASRACAIAAEGSVTPKETSP
jgi:seryl-tRNA(Sec) selenium transferase